MRRLLKRLEALFAAAAFAEEGDADTARHLAVEAERDEGAPVERLPAPSRPAPGPLPVPTRARGA